MGSMVLCCRENSSAERIKLIGWWTTSKLGLVEKDIHGD